MRIYRPRDGRDVPSTVEIVRAGNLQDCRAIGVIENGKPMARELLSAFAELVRDQTNADQVEVVTKPTATAPIDQERIDAIAAAGAVAFAGVGDCGACTAYSVEDAVLLERQGIPTALVVTTPFVDLARTFASSLGAPDIRLVVVDHPVATQTDDEVLATARRHVTEAVEALSVSTQPDVVG